MTEINTCGLAMAMFRQMRKVEPTEQSRDKPKRESEDQAAESLQKDQKVDIVV